MTTTVGGPPLPALLARLGYGPDLVAAQYRAVVEGSVRVVEFAGFARPVPKDVGTAVLLAGSSDRPDAVRGLMVAAEALAVPAVVAFAHDRVKVFAADRPDRPEFDVGRYDLDALTSLARDVGPQALWRAKRGHHQQSLFTIPAGSLTAATGRQEALLTHELRRAADGPLAGLGAQDRTLMLAGALCALVLADKSGRRDSAERIVAATAEREPALLGWATRPDAPRTRALVETVRDLADALDFTAFDSNVLSRVYEEFVVGTDDRRAKGVHYTPQGLAERMLAALPIEGIRPEERVVFDPACGSGTLLVAAHDRLVKLQPARDGAAVHADAVARLAGRDTDGFAVLLTKIALSLHAVPPGNGWHVEEGDSLVEDGGAGPAARPSVAVANPPFRLATAGGPRTELAARFLDGIVGTLVPDGLLAVVMPASWATGTRDVRASRERFSAACDLYEMWRLPRGTFTRSNASTVVLIGRKRRPGERPAAAATVVDRVGRPDLVDAFYRRLPGASDRALTTTPFVFAAATDSALRRGTGLRLGDVAVVRTGAELSPRGRELERAAALDGPFLWLDGLRGTGRVAVDRHALRGRVPVPGPWKVNFPHWQAASAKVLVGTQATSDSPFLRVLVDDTGGVVAGKGTIWVVPRPGAHFGQALHGHESALALTALLMSSAAAAWMDESRPDRNNRTQDLRRLPVPDRDADWAALAEAGARLRDATAPDARRHALVAADRVVDAAYRLDGSAREAVAMRLAGATDVNLGRPRYGPSVPGGPAAGDQDTFEADGTVVAVHGQRVTLSVPDVTPAAGAEIDLPHRMPGHLARPGRGFRVRLGDDDDLTAADYLPHTMDWGDAADVTEQVTARYAHAQPRDGLA